MFTIEYKVNGIWKTWDRDLNVEDVLAATSMLCDLGHQYQVINQDTGMSAD